MAKPVVVGPVDDNVFAVIGVTRRALRRHGDAMQLADFDRRLAYITSGVDKETRVSGYDRVLALCMEFVDFDL
jgi:hypothetical protein